MEATEQLTAPAIDKSAWGPGPWQDEPDRVDFVHAGFACFVRRVDPSGHLCGYVGVPREHPLYGVDFGNLPDDLEAHGGINYAKPCCEESGVCHVPEPGMPTDVWWLGFDCAHGFDLCPGRNAMYSQILVEHAADIPPEVREAFETMLSADVPNFLRERYRDLPYVRRQIESLAEQLAPRGATA